MFETIAFILGLIWLLFPFWLFSYLKEMTALQREGNELLRYLANKEHAKMEERLKERQPKLPPAQLPAMPVPTQPKEPGPYKI